MAPQRHVVWMNIVVFMALTLAAQPVFAVALTPNPNPAGNTITVVNGSLLTVGNSVGVTYNNNGVINIDSGGTIRNASGTTFATFQNNSGANLNNSGAFINWDEFNNYAGADYTITLSGVHEERWEFWSEGSITNHGAFNLLDWSGYGAHAAIHGSFTNHSTGDIYLGPDSTMGMGAAATFTNYGHITDSSDSEMGTSGAFTNYGTITTQGQFANYTSGALDSHSLIDSTGSFYNYGTFSNKSGGTLNIHDYAWSDGTINNAGLIVIDTGAEIDTTFSAYFGPSYFYQTAGETVVNGILYQNHVDVGGGIVHGTGDLRAYGDGGGLNVHGTGWVQPGLSPGALTVSGNVTYDGGGLEIEIQSDTVYDLLQIYGSLTVNAGELRFVFLDDYVPAEGQTFDFLTASGGITGLENFDITVEGLPGAVVDVNAASGALTMTFMEVPEPASLTLVGVGAAGLFGYLRRRRRT